MMGTSRIVAATMASLLIAAPVLAQPKPPTPDQKRQAGELVKQAIAKSQANDHQGAIDLYLGAFAIVPLPLLLSNIGSEYKSLNKPVESLKYYCKYLEADPTGQNASFATAEAKVLQIQLGNTTVDDKNVCAPPPPKPPDPIKPPPPPPPHEELGTTSNSAPGKNLEIAGMVVGGLGIIGLGTGIFFGAKARSISNEISDHDKNMPWPTDINQKEKDGQAAEDKQIILMTVGGLVLAGGAVLYYIGHTKKTSAAEKPGPTVTVAPSAGIGSVGVVVVGGF